MSSVKPHNGQIDKEKINKTVFQHFFYDSPLAMYSCDREGFITHFNEAAVTLWGRRPEIGKDLWCGSWKIFTIDGTHMPIAECPMARALKEGKAFDNRIIVIETPNHIFKNLMVYARPIFDEHQQQIGAHNTLIDITEQSFIDKKQATLSAIVESSEHAIISKNLDGIITSWNTGAEQIFGYKENEIIGKSINMLIPESRRDEETGILYNIKRGVKVDHLQTIRVSKNGNEIPISLTVSPVKDSTGKIIGASKIARDITEELRTLKAIKQNTENLETLNTIGKIILEKLDVKVILQQVIDATTKIAGADYGAFYYTAINEESETVKLKSFAGNFLTDTVEINPAQDELLFEQIHRCKNVIRSNDVVTDNLEISDILKFTSATNNLPIASYLQIPVTSSYGAIIGCLIFGHQDKGAFKQEHEDIIGSIASQAAVALDNSRLFEEVKALSAKKDEFIALASHELKTPLTSIKGYLQISARSEKNKLGSQFIDKALSQVHKLNSLITDLLDSSKIVAGKLQFNAEVFDLEKLIIEVIETFNYTNKSHQIIFNPTNVEYIIEADEQRMEQVMINLLSNAIKYSPNADKVYITIAPDNGFVQVKIRDEGIGLSSSQQRKIFTRFYRAEMPANISGLGLGLYLTKEIIERHNGSINVNSEYGKGAEFYFSVPLKVNHKDPG